MVMLLYEKLKKILKLKTCLVLFVLFVAINLVYALKLPKINIDTKKTSEKIIKAISIVILIKQFGEAINNFINELLMTKGAANRDATKVVPILTFGQGFEAGACQVSGKQEDVDKVQIVIAISATLDKGKKFNIQALVPSASINPSKIDRVYGVGITAVIDYKL